MPETTEIQEDFAPAQTPSGGARTLRLDRAELLEGWAEQGRTPQMVASIRVGAKTDLGRVRENNEDKFEFHEPEDPAVLAAKGCFYAVADGMGGHSAGQIACELALKTVIRSYYTNPTSDIESGLRQAIEEANSLIFDTARMIPERHGMGTTLTAAIVRDDEITFAQVGDSRAYLIRAGTIRQLTEDHSWVAEQVRMGSMSLAEAQTSPFRNIITRSIGTAANTEPDISSLGIEAGDTFVLCSDGLSGHLEAEEIRDLAIQYSPSVAAMRLVEQANERGGRDNITALILSVRSLAPYSSETLDAVDDGADAPRKAEKRGWGRRR